MVGTRKFENRILGEKIGMTTIFADDGQSIPITIVKATPCFVLEVKNSSKHGYSALKVGYKTKKRQRVNKPDLGSFIKAGTEAFYYVKELRLNSDDDAQRYNPSDELKASDFFKEGDTVDVTGTSIGKGFQGVVKRHNAKGQPATRGTHEVRRHVGSVGCRKTPGRILKNKIMPGRMGGEKVTVQNLKLMSVLAEENLILIRGSIPGNDGSLVIVKTATKK
jgi:large subunit ribosomal protein L3